MNSPPPQLDATKPTSRSFPAHRAPAAAAPRGLERLSIPRPRLLLAAVLLGRVILVTLALGRELGPRSGPPDAALGSFVAVAVIAFLASVWLAWSIRRPSGLPSPAALLLQSAVDVVVVTTLVTFQSGPTAASVLQPGGSTSATATSVAALYIALVTVYALLLPVGRTLITIALAMTCYVAVTLTSSASSHHGISLAPAPNVSFWIQVVIIALVGVVIAVLGNRLTSASQEHLALSAALVQARLEADEILGSIHSGVISVDADGRLGYLNPGGRAILGADTTSFVVGQPVLEALRSRSREMHDAISRGLTEGVRVARGEAQVRRDDGTLFPVGLSITTVARPESDRRLVTAIFTDISDLKRLQEFRLRAERLEAVAALSASLAHEIRNPLMAIRSAVEQLARLVGDDEDDQTLGRLVMRESERLNRLLSEFLDFSRVRAAKFERLSIKSLVRDTVRIVAEHPEARGVEIAVEGDSVEMDGDTDLMNRVVSNLVLNAAQALAGSGRIKVWVGYSRPGDAPGGNAERPIKIVVSDNGPGIPEEVRDRLFEPFVTGRTGGTGLGLAIVQRAVAAHRGVILVDSSPDTGTTFSIFFPATWNREDRT